MSKVIGRRLRETEEIIGRELGSVLTTPPVAHILGELPVRIGVDAQQYEYQPGEKVFSVTCVPMGLSTRFSVAKYAVNLNIWAFLSPWVPNRQE